MINEIVYLFRFSIARKLLIVAFSGYILITIIVTGLHMAFEYKAAEKFVTTEIDQYKKIVLQGLRQALEEENIVYVQNTIKRILKSPVIYGIQIVSTLNDLQLSYLKVSLMEDDVVLINNRDYIEKQINKLHLKQHLVDVGKESKIVNENNIVGRVIFYSHPYAVFNQVKRNFIVIISNALIKSFAFWIFFLWAGYQYVTKNFFLLQESLQLIQSEKYKLARKKLKNIELPKTELDYLNNALITLIEKLQKSKSQHQMAEKRFAAIINKMPLVVIELDQNLCIVGWNHQAEIDSDVPKELMLGNTLQIAFNPFAKYHDIAEIVYYTKKTVILQKEKYYLTKGKKIYDIVMYPINNKRYSGVIILMRDITLYEDIKSMAYQSEKLHSIGQLAAGVAHEINNPLSVIVNAVQNIERRCMPNRECNQKIAKEYNISLVALNQYMEEKNIYKQFENIKTTSIYVGHIVTSLIRYSFERECIKEVVRVKDVINMSMRMLKEDFILKKKINLNAIQIVSSIPDNIPDILCIPEELGQVVFNLLKNSAYALDQVSHEKIIKIDVYRQRNAIHIDIKDNGTGISSAIKNKVFDPFFTTKPHGCGSGLGLAISYNIITLHHQGQLTYESKLGKGTIFKVTLPINLS